MAVGFALAAGLIKGFTNNIGREAARREKDDARLDKLEEMLFASMLKPVDERPGVDAINSIQNTLQGAKKAQAERGDINLFGTPGKRIDLDLMKTANLLNEVKGGTLNFGGLKMPISKLYGTKALLNKPFEQGQEWLRAVNVYLNNPNQRANFFFHLQNNKQAKSLFTNEYKRHARLFLNGYTDTFSKDGDENKSYTRVIDNFNNFKDVDNFVGDIGLNNYYQPIDTVSEYKLLKKQPVAKNTIFFEVINPETKTPILLSHSLDEESYKAVSNISKRLGKKRPSEFIFDFQKISGQTPLTNIKDAKDMYSHIFDAIELEKLNFASLTRTQTETNQIARYLLDKRGNDRFSMALSVMPLLGRIDSLAKFEAQNMNYVRGMDRVSEVEKIMNLGKGGAKKITANYTDALGVQKDLRKLFTLMKQGKTGVGLAQNIGSFFRGLGDQVDQIGNLLSDKVDVENGFDQNRFNSAIEGFIASRRGLGGSSSENNRLGQIDALVISLAARMARAVDPSGRLSNQDFEVQLNRLGQAGIFTSRERQQASIQEVIADFDNQVNRLKVVNDILEGRGGSVQYSLSDTERRLLYADRQIQTILKTADEDITSTLGARGDSYSVAKANDRIAVAENYVGLRGEPVEIQFDRSNNQIMGRFFVDGKPVDRNKVRRKGANFGEASQFFTPTETEPNVALRGPATKTFVGDDPATEDVSTEIRENIKRSPKAEPFPQAIQPLSQTGQQEVTTNQTDQSLSTGVISGNDVESATKGSGDEYTLTLKGGRKVIAKKLSGGNYEFVREISGGTQT